MVYHLRDSVPLIKDQGTLTTRFFLKQYKKDRHGHHATRSNETQVAK